MHPLTVTVYFLSVTLLAMFIQNPVIYALALIGAAAMRLCLKSGSFSWWIVLIAPLGIALTNPIVSHLGKTVLFKVFGAKVTLESILFGLCAGVMLAAVVIWFNCFGQVMGSDRSVYLMGRRLPRAALTLTIALRFIPLMMRQMVKITRAQKTMGMYGSGSFFSRIKSSGATLVTLIASSAENAMDTADAMNARGYGLKGRTGLIKYRMTVRDCALTALCALLAGVVLFASARSQLDFDFYPVLSIAPLSGVGIAAYVAYGFLSLLMPLLELVEELRWKYCVSKI